MLIGNSKLNAPRMEVHLHFKFLDRQAFKEFNRLLQTQDNLIAILCSKCNKYTNKIAPKFLKLQCFIDIGGADVGKESNQNLH